MGRRPMVGMVGRCLGVLALLLALCVTGAPAALAKSAKKPLPKAAKVSLLLGSNKRDVALLSGLKVKVKADRAVKVSVSIGNGLAGKARAVTFKKRGTSTLVFKLSAAGRKAFEACGNGNVPVKVTASYLVPKKGSRTKKVTKKVTQTVAVKWTGPTCTVTPPPVTDSTRCDPIDPDRCMLPFPNNYFTKADPSSATGLRINFQQAAMPADKNGAHIDPTEWNRNDGFSPGQPITVTVPGLDNQAAFDQSGIVPLTNMADYTRAGQPVVVINATTGARQLIWAEIDSSAGSAANTSLIIRPGKNWTEGQRYIVALRNLKKADGTPVDTNAAFKQYRDDAIPASAAAAVKDRKPAMEDIFAKLQSAGIDRSSLNLAWDFTIASRENLAGRMLAIRNDAFAKLGDTNLSNQTVEGTAPAFTATAEDLPADTKFARKVTGTFQVPCYLNSAGCAQGGTFNYAPGDTNPDRTPVRNGTFTATYTCRIPRDSLSGPIVTGARGVIYGHGLLGGQGEVGQGQISDMAFDHKAVYCATDWYGMASGDIGTVAGILTNLSNFPKLPDRVQQGMLSFLFLGRLLAAPAAQGGFASSPAFQDGSSTPVIQANHRIYYDGNSQGGIIGGAVVAVAPDLDRGTLGVLGMNYSTLLQRSTDFSNYAKVLYGAYPDTLDRQLYLSLMQMLWDRGEANGYAEHMTTDPYPNTPAHQVLLHAAFGDHQVANVSALVEARTIGARIYTPDGVADHALDPGRWNPVSNPFLGIDPITSFPYSGSALVLFDSGPLRDGGTKGTNYSPLTNAAPTDADGNDPHEFPRRTATGQQMKSDFYTPGGQVTKACGSGPCYSDGFTGAP